MDKLPIEILREKCMLFRPQLIKEFLTDDSQVTDEVVLAMEAYAEQEAKAYASWLSCQVIEGRTASKLWSDYKKSLQ